MSFTTDPNVLIIYALIFLLGLLVGVFLTAGGRRKWKTRYNSEAERRKELERAHEQRVRDWEEREKEWRERDSLRAAAIKDPREPGDQEIRGL
jgi:Flp pilus assembly protein TadB